MNRFTPKQYLNVKHKDLPFIKEICLHEINLAISSNPENISSMLVMYYTAVLSQCYNEANYLFIYRKEQIIPTAIQYISKSTTLNEAVNKMNTFYDPNHPLRFALDMQYIYNYKFENNTTFLRGFSTYDILQLILKYKVLNQTPRLPIYLINKLMNQPIIIVDNDGERIERMRKDKIAKLL